MERDIKRDIIVQLCTTNRPAWFGRFQTRRTTKRNELKEVVEESVKVEQVSSLKYLL